MKKLCLVTFISHWKQVCWTQAGFSSYNFTLKNHNFSCLINNIPTIHFSETQRNKTQNFQSWNWSAVIASSDIKFFTRFPRNGTFVKTYWLIHQATLAFFNFLVTVIIQKLVGSKCLKRESIVIFFQFRVFCT